MAVLLVSSRSEEAPQWERLLRQRMPDADFRVYPACGVVEDIDVALAWKPPHGALARFPRLTLIYSLGMGVDHLLSDPLLPDVPIARLIDANMVHQMSEYALYAVLHFHRRFDVYEAFQRARRWEELPLPHTAERRVGILGIGVIGSECARKLAALGFRVLGWSRTRKELPGVECWHGLDRLPMFLREAEILLVLLPATPETTGILDAARLRMLQPGAYLINIARGNLVVEADLLQALDAGHIAGAFLDVTQEEPLMPASPLWMHPKVRVTPHIAGLTNPATAIVPIVDNLRRLRSGLPLRDLVDRARGY